MLPLWNNPSFRPILLALVFFFALNLFVTIAINGHNGLYERFHLKYGDYLPTKQRLMANLPQTHAPEILFLGTSQTNNGFVPEAFEHGLSINQDLPSPPPNLPPLGGGTALSAPAFNLGLPNNRYDVMQAVLESHRQQHGKPKLVMIELSQTIQSRSGEDGNYYLPALYFHSVLRQNPKMGVYYQQTNLLHPTIQSELAGNLLSALREFRYSFSPVQLFKKSVNRLTQSDSAQAKSEENSQVDSQADQQAIETLPAEALQTGWVPRGMSPEMATAAGTTKTVSEADRLFIQPIQHMDFSPLRQLVRYCQANQIPVVLVAWPNHPAYRARFNDSRWGKVFSAEQQKLVQETGVPVIDLQTELPSETAGLFADPRHLRYQYASVVSKRLGERIASQNLLHTAQ